MRRLCVPSLSEAMHYTVSHGIIQNVLHSLPATVVLLRALLKGLEACQNAISGSPAHEIRDNEQCVFENSPEFRNIEKSFCVYFKHS